MNDDRFVSMVAIVALSARCSPLGRVNPSGQEG
jgi:hypothetical protein